MGRTIATNTERLHKEIAAVLSASGKSLHYKEIAKEIGKRRTFKDLGPDPARKVYSAIQNDIRLHPEVTRFEKTGLGKFALKGQPSVKQRAFVPSGTAAVNWQARSVPKREVIWTELTAKHAKSPNKRPCEIQALPQSSDLFLGLDPAGHRMLYLKCELKEGHGGPIKKGKYFHAWKDERFNPLDGRQRVMLEQLPDDPEDVFTALVIKVLRELRYKPVIDPRVFREAIETAVADFEGTGDGALNHEQQMGLIAELWLLRNVLMKYLTPEEAIAAWHGQDGSEKDFWLAGVHIEVKATGKNSRWVTISSIKQLETDNGSPPLYLFNLSLAKSLAKDPIEGKTLSGYVDEIREDLRNRKDVADRKKCRRDFDKRLFGAIPTDLGAKNYREDHREKYTTKYRVYWDEERGNAERGTFYLVHGDFPRLRAAAMDEKGVKVTTYDIDLARCDEFQRDEKDVVPLIKVRGEGA